MIGQRDSAMWGVLIVLLIFSALIGKNQMIRIIIGNYILMIIALSFNGAVDMWSWTLPQVSTGEGFNIVRFLLDGRVTVTLIIYAALLALVFKKSTLHSSHPGLLDKGFAVLLVPMTVASIILTLSVVFLGTSVFDPGSMARIAQNIGTTMTAQSLIQKIPVRMLCHGIATILLTTHLSLSFLTRKPLKVVDTILE